MGIVNVWEQAATNDPETSKLAAEAAVETGLVSRHREIVVGLVTRHPGSTSLELAHCPDSKLDRYQIARLLRGLARAGLVREGPARECRAGHRPALTWWPPAVEQAELNFEI